MRDDMKVGDLVLFYHSNTKPPHVAGIARVCREGYPDHTAQDVNSKYFDPKASAENPRWMMVDIEPIEAMKRIVTLPDMKSNPALEGMPLLAKGSRLSVQTVPAEYFAIVRQMGGLS
jgi:predicted RNA-binding protein with PUA-like domain